MTSSPHGISTQHVNAYHQTNSLLFQFILAEFIEVFDEIQRLDALCCRKSTSMGTLPTNEDSRAQIRTVLSRLVGSPRDYMRVFTWNFSEGLLMKLKTYSALFLQNSDSAEKDLIAMQNYTEKVWQECVLAIDAVYDDHNILLTAIEKASYTTERLAKLVARLIPQFRDDENVIFFLLKHKDLFDKLYGSRFMIKLLNRMYPKGLRDVHQTITKKFFSRGFENILPAINAKIEELETSAL